MEKLSTRSESLTLQRNISGLQTTSAPSWEAIVQAMREAGAMEWEIRLAQLAQDMRHDLEPGAMRLWKEKLSEYKDLEICEAIDLYRGEYFPSSNAIIEIVERRRRTQADDRLLQSTNDLRAEFAKIDEFKKTHGGKTPQQLFCEENRALINKLDMNLVAARSRRDAALLSQARALKTGAVRGAMSR